MSRGSVSYEVSADTTEWEDILIKKNILTWDEVMINKGLNPDEVGTLNRIQQSTNLSFEYNISVFITEFLGSGEGK